MYLAVRTPAQWREIAGTDRQLASRMGLFNDGLLSSGTDMGTYDMDGQGDERRSREAADDEPLVALGPGRQQGVDVLQPGWGDVARPVVLQVGGEMHHTKFSSGGDLRRLAQTLDQAAGTPGGAGYRTGRPDRQSSPGRTPLRRPTCQKPPCRSPDYADRAKGGRQHGALLPGGPQPGGPARRGGRRKNRDSPGLPPPGGADRGGLTVKPSRCWSSRRTAVVWVISSRYPRRRRI